ncbi:MAG: hypothetical protein COB65_05345 [Thalassobium sp.]|uniref:hypothetical protein n=1 Tax=Octadecabacter sp. SW4 TaxID=2602067 RepID=UPI000C0CA9C9|nr:hypothetical protein [Octadecabacter sp. SW4]PHQ84534.1 MAG: hypothetical protein COB65_05345 [Thalassobium sp.]QEE34600.1 hypothetical protein FTO60_02065 [Octadecabacter sp. SW4]|tara:strand:+ start:502 stop:807 length:306 start_codon:yes stop_codon:yes gene_type:complete
MRFAALIKPGSLLPTAAGSITKSRNLILEQFVLAAESSNDRFLRRMAARISLHAPQFWRCERRQQEITMTGLGPFTPSPPLRRRAALHIGSELNDAILFVS